MYLRPLTALGIGGNVINNLMATTDASVEKSTSTLSFVQVPNTEMTQDFTQMNIQSGEEIMFAINIPYTPLPEMPMAQTSTADSSFVSQLASKQKFDYIMKDCREFTDHMEEGSAEHVINVKQALANFYRRKYDKKIDVKSILTTLEEAPKHREISSGTTNYGNLVYSYDPEHGYLGKDSVVFSAEFEGKRYKVVMELRVLRGVGNGTDCPEPHLIKVGQLLPPLNNCKVTFSQLLGAAVGQTTGQGKDTQITIDTNATGHGWFIDSTPDQNDEFLPTSNPDVWIAKAGSVADGKMDRLSVLLHEYGHALGIEHSGDDGDFMAASLQPGERRLLSSDELSLMARLVAALKQTPGDPNNPSDPGTPGLPMSSLGLLALGRLRRADYGWILNVDQTQLVSRVDLSFTIANNGMQSNGVDEDGSESGPDDAFEVALLEHAHIV